MTTRKVSDLMSKPPLICAPGDMVRRAAEIMRDRKVSCLGVVEGERFVGILTVRDLVAPRDCRRSEPGNDARFRRHDRRSRRPAWRGSRFGHPAPDAGNAVSAICRWWKGSALSA